MADIFRDVDKVMRGYDDRGEAITNLRCSKKSDIVVLFKQYNALKRSVLKVKRL